jgi:hypothetical protein
MIIKLGLQIEIHSTNHLVFIPLSKTVDPISDIVSLRCIIVWCKRCLYLVSFLKRWVRSSLLDIVSLKFFSLVSYSFHLLCRDWWNKLLKQRQLDNRNIFPYFR